MRGSDGCAALDSESPAVLVPLASVLWAALPSAAASPCSGCSPVDVGLVAKTASLSSSAWDTRVDRRLRRCSGDARTAEPECGAGMNTCPIGTALAGAEMGAPCEEIAASPSATGAREDSAGDTTSPETEPSSEGAADRGVPCPAAAMGKWMAGVVAKADGDAMLRREGEAKAVAVAVSVASGCDVDSGDVADAAAAAVGVTAITTLAASSAGTAAEPLLAEASASSWWTDSSDGSSDSAPRRTADDAPG